ncbi:sigma-70 family RNA polymerase sigma factor [Inquilinus sp. Marseille-Q2685]|uniref:sigma-70 family RNA polymerase sigma factor n=1 Tax=Inquilinus sp. Marseille-Q2685 TaxID=2866581 RepID=UPI0027295FAF|nr:sigma-70 family RNA polymerase sigma factor [Inquilinus sp. Marseille-Q2685]
MAEQDRSSLLALLTRHYQELLRHLTRRLGSASAAADVAQDTWLRLRRAETVPELQNPQAYLFRIADNLARDRLRSDAARARTLLPAELGDDRPSDAPGAESVLDHRQRLQVLERAVAELPPKCREVFLLHKFDGLGHGEIAARLGISRSMVEKHVMKALAHCRDRMRDLLD